MGKFDDIRPYNDNEVRSTLDRIIADPEFVDAIGSFRFPRLYKLMPWLFKPLVRNVAENEVRGVTYVLEFERVV